MKSKLTASSGSHSYERTKTRRSWSRTTRTSKKLLFQQGSLSNQELELTWEVVINKIRVVNILNKAYQKANAHKIHIIMVEMVETLIIQWLKISETI